MNLSFSTGGSRCASDWAICVSEGRPSGAGADGIVFIMAKDNTREMAAEEIANAAASIADVVLRGLGEHPVIQMSIQESEVTIERATVSDDSILVGKKFGDIRLGSISGMYVIAIKRGNQFIYGPDKFTTINAGDVLIARGPEESADYFMDLATGEAREF